MDTVRTKPSSSSRDLGTENESNTSAPSTVTMDGTKLLSMHAVRLPSSPVPVSSTVQRHPVRSLQRIADNRYVEQELWLRHLMSKVGEINIYSAPPEETDGKVSAKAESEMTPSTAALAEATEAAAESPVGSEESPSSLQKEARPLSDEVVEVSESSQRLMQKPALSTIAEERSGEMLPSSSPISSRSTPISSDSFTKSSTVPSTRPTDLDEDTSSRNTTLTAPTSVFSRSVNSSKLAPTSVAQNTKMGAVESKTVETKPMSVESKDVEWVGSEDMSRARSPSGVPLLSEGDDIGDFIQKMMTPAAAVVIETVNMGETINCVDFVYIDADGKITHVCGPSEETSDGAEVD